MDKKYFIGGGLSAYFSQLMHWSQGDVCVYPINRNNPYLLRRPTLEINKLISTKEKSIGSNEYILGNSVLHDRDKIGGNSEIWGGFFNTNNIQSLEKLRHDGVNLVPLALECTGSLSNIKTLVQLQDQQNRILNVTNYLKNGICNYLDSFECADDKIQLRFNKVLSTSQKRTVKVSGEVFICTGVIQTIDLLTRSNIIKKNDILTLDEHESSIIYSEKIDETANANCCIISYTILQAIYHYIGYRNIKKTKNEIFQINQRQKLIHQIFYPKINKLYLKVGANSVTRIKILNTKNKFGKSIHYCNLRINGESLVDMMARINPRLHFIGMASVKQDNPGPISSDIFSHIEKLQLKK